MQSLLLFTYLEVFLTLSLHNSTIDVNKKFRLHIFCEIERLREVPMIINFTLSMLGFLIVIRTFRRSAEEFAIPATLVLGVSTAFLLTIGSALLFLHARPFSLWLFIGIIWISLNFFPHFLRIHLLQTLKRQLVPLMDQVILGLQTGQSFRGSLLRAIEGQRSWHRRQFFEIYHVITRSEARPQPSKTGFLADLAEEWREMDRSQNKVIDQVRAFRRQLKTEEDFRRRSGQVTQQIRLQAIIVTAMYLGLLVFVSCNFGFLAHLHLIFFASLLFSGGLVWIFSVGRKMKWKT